MACKLPEPEIKRKVKQEADLARQVCMVLEVLEEVLFCYEGECGAAEPFLDKIRVYLTEAWNYYNRHRNPQSNLQGESRRALQLAHRISVKAIVRGLNSLLEESNKPCIHLPVTIGDLEKACDTLFHYIPLQFIGEKNNGGQPTGSSRTQDGDLHAGAIPMA